MLGLSKVRPPGEAFPLDRVAYKSYEVGVCIASKELDKLRPQLRSEGEVSVFVQAKEIRGEGSGGEKDRGVELRGEP
jgi:hypothetical protein